MLVVTAPDGERRKALFGPGPDAVPAGADAMRLGEAILLVTGIPAFREVKC